MKKVYKKAFTLAETLLVIGIIGVVAAVTISIVKNIQEQTYIQAWKKEYSSISQAYSQILAENGGSIKNLYPSVDFQADSVTLLNLFKDKMKVIKFCDTTSRTVFNCWHPVENDAEAVHDKLGNKAGFWDVGNQYPAMILQDGALVHLMAARPDCGGAVQACGGIVIDTNGKKGPNIMGKDVFWLYILGNKFAPMGSKDVNLFGSCDTTGYGCAAEYLSR